MPLLTRRLRPVKSCRLALARLGLSTLLVREPIHEVLAHRYAAVGTNGLTHDPVRVLRAEEGDDAREIIWLTNAAERRLGDGVVVGAAVVGAGDCVGGCDQALRSPCHLPRTPTIMSTVLRYSKSTGIRGKTSLSHVMKVCHWEIERRKKNV